MLRFLHFVFYLYYRLICKTCYWMMTVLTKSGNAVATWGIRADLNSVTYRTRYQAGPRPNIRRA